MYLNLESTGLRWIVIQIDILSRATISSIINGSQKSVDP